MKIMALDPGGTTGVAFYHREDEDVWFRTQLAGEHHEELYDILEAHAPDTVIYERFMYQRRELTRGVTLNLDAVEYIGVTKYWHSKHFETVNLICQTPHQAKKFWDDDKLKTLGLYIAGAPHANDATRHLLYYLAFSRNEKTWVSRLRA